MIGSPFERTRSEECLSDFALDDLVGERKRSPHLDGCGFCSARYRELEEARDRFVMPARRRSPPVRAIGLALAACLAAIFFWPASEDGFRTKGGPRIGFYVKHGEAVRRGSDGDQLAPKDAIRFSYSADRAYHLAVLSIDPMGAVSVYYPEGDRTHLEAAGNDVALPLSTVLDESVGREKIFALFCEQPIDLARTKDALASAGDVGGDRCHADRLDWIKR